MPADEPAIELSLAGQRVRLAGSTLCVGDDPPFVLGARERDVLAVLIDRGGGVVSKRDLLRLVWGPGARGTHVVEVTVGRLRRHLGAASAGVETVIRRGYRLRLG